MKAYVLILLLAQAAGEATLAGRVVDSITHQPVVGARVFYCCIYNGNTTSDANGAWLLHAAIKPGDAGGFLVITKSGYSELRHRLVLKAGDSERREFELSPAAHLSGRLTDRDSGKPLAGLKVTAHRRYGTDYLAKPSGADGSFTFIADLQSGGYTLEIDSAPGDVKQDEPGYGRVWFPGVPRVEMAAPVMLAAGENRDLEIRLQKRELFHIAGVIQGEGGAISLAVLNNRQVVQHDLPKAGTFRIDGLNPGTYSLFAMFAGNGKMAARDRAFASATVEITDHSVEDLKLSMRPGVSIRANFHMSEENAEIPANVHLIPMPASPEMGTGFPPPAPESDGLAWQGLPPGPYFVTADVPRGFAAASVSVDGRPAGNDPVDLESPMTLADVVITSRPAGLAGVVRDSERKPLAEAGVVLAPEMLTERSNPLAVAVATSDKDGAFRFANLAPGRYKVFALPGADRELANDDGFLRERMRSVEAIALDFGQIANVELLVK